MIQSFCANTQKEKEHERDVDVLQLLADARDPHGRGSGTRATPEPAVARSEGRRAVLVLL